MVHSEIHLSVRSLTIKTLNNVIIELLNSINELNLQVFMLSTADLLIFSSFVLLNYKLKIPISFKEIYVMAQYRYTERKRLLDLRLSNPLKFYK